MKIANIILLSRRKAGKTQLDMAGLLGVTRQSAMNFEKGTTPRMETLISICKILNIPVQDMATAIKEEEEERGLEIGQRKADEFLKNYDKD